MLRDLTRRSFISSLCALPLSGCQSSETATVRYRVIASAYVDGEKVEASSVMEVRYRRVTHTLSGAGGVTNLYGEALIFRLKDKGTIFILPLQHMESGPLSQVYEPGILTTLGVKNSIGTLSELDFKLLNNASGRTAFNFYSKLPAFVSFSDESRPNTIFEVDPYQIGKVFPGVKFISLDIEITDAPITEVLATRLPWVRRRGMKTAFDRDPPGRLRPAKNTPLGFMMSESRFFGNGSR